MSAVSIIELDTTGPVIDFGVTFIDNDFKVHIPFDINEPAVAISAILETDIGNFLGTIVENTIIFNIPLIETFDRGNLFVTAKDEVFNIKVSATTVLLWFSSILDIAVFESPDLEINILDFPELILSSFEDPTTKIAMANETDLTIEVNLDTVIAIDLIKDPELTTIVLPDIDIDTEMM